jgi:DNA processing protein
MSEQSNKIRLISALLELDSVGPARALNAIRLLEVFPQEPELLVEALHGIQTKLGPAVGKYFNLTVSVARSIFDAADRMIEKCEQNEIKIAVPGASSFWSRIWDIPSAPARLFYRGRLTDAVDQFGIAVIGTRHPSEFGKKSCARIVKRCVEQKLTIVSGLAIGCDTVAHESAIQCGGFTIAVLAHGLDTVYPTINKRLAAEIIDTGGLLVSEYPPGEEMRPNYLVARDRLQSGLSRAVIVIESDLDGGSMHAANASIKQKRMLGCLNHPAELRMGTKHQGNQKLILQDGAKSLGTPEELQIFLDEINRISTQLPKPTATKTQIPETPIQQVDMYGTIIKPKKK